MSKKLDIENFIPELLPIEKSFHQQIIDVKTTIVKMFINRGFINQENKDKYIKKLIETENDDMEFILQLDIEKNYNTEIKNKKVYIKIFDYKISSINKTSPIGEFISKYEKEYKFLVVQDISTRAQDMVDSYETQVEIFKFNKLQSDITEHDYVPQHVILTKEEGDKVLEAYRARKRDMPLIRSNDPVAKYYNVKPGEIVKIFRPSPSTSKIVAYRLVIKSKDLKAKT
jgi:DNA-directed RNA polymerase subunit H (RpoH/RPB5)